MTDDKFYTSLSANNIMAKLTNHVQRTRLITPSTDKHYSLDSEDDFRSGCRNVSHQQQFFSELLSPGRSHNTNYFPITYLVYLEVKLDDSFHRPEYYPFYEYSGPVLSSIAMGTYNYQSSSLQC